MGAPALIVHVALWGATVVPAAVVHASPELAHDVRTALAFRFEPRPGTLNEALGILGTNARVTATLLLAAFAVTRAPVVRPALDALVAVVVLTNATVVGVAIGAYGKAALPWLVHLPVEWGALATATAAYARSRAGPARVRESAARTAALLVIAALIEAYLTPQA